MLYNIQWNNKLTTLLECHAFQTDKYNFHRLKLNQTIINFLEAISAFGPLEKDTSYSSSTFRSPSFISGKKTSVRLMN